MRKSGACTQLSTGKGSRPRDGIDGQRVPIWGTGLDGRLVHPPRSGFFFAGTSLGAEEIDKKDSQSGKG